MSGQSILINNTINTTAYRQEQIIYVNTTRSFVLLSWSGSKCRLTTVFARYSLDSRRLDARSQSLIRTSRKLTFIGKRVVKEGFKGQFKQH